MEERREKDRHTDRQRQGEREGGREECKMRREKTEKFFKKEASFQAGHLKFPQFPQGGGLE